MKKLVASVLALALTIALAPINLIAAARFQAGSIAGIATVDGKPLANVTVRLRNVDSGQLVGNMQSGANGAFNFTGLPAGNYVVETVSASGTMLGTSTRIALAAGAMAATGITVGTSAAALAAAGGVAGAAGGAAAGGATAGGAAAAAGGGAFFTTTAGIVTLAAIGTGIGAGIVIANDNASPSQ